MPEKAKQEQQQLSKGRQDREKSAPPKSSANLPPIYDEIFARRAGQIIASALAGARAKRKYLSLPSPAFSNAALATPVTVLKRCISQKCLKTYTIGTFLGMPARVDSVS